MSALEQKVNSGQISDVSLRISEQMPGAFSDLARKHQVPGAQFAIYHGGSIVAHEIGELEFGTGLHVTRDAVFPIGSITKFSTATVAMILVADGDVDLDAPIHDYVPEMGDLGEMISLRQLLSHTSGLAESSGMEEKSGSSLRHYLVEHVRGRNLVLPPGTGFSYSNPGYIVAGRLIETVTGMSWAEAVESILLRPLGIQPAFVNPHGTMPPRRNRMRDRKPPFMRLSHDFPPSGIRLARRRTGITTATTVTATSLTMARAGLGRSRPRHRLRNRVRPRGIDCAIGYARRRRNQLGAIAIGKQSYLRCPREKRPT